MDGRALPDAASASQPQFAPPGPVLLTVADAARILAISRSKTYELVTARELEVVHIGRLIRVPVSSIHRFIAGLQKGDAPDASAADEPRQSSALGLPTA